MKRLFAIILAIAMLLTMVACSKSDKTDGNAADSGSSDSSDTGAAAGETIKIGFAFPMSGSAAMAGNYSTHGAKVIENELNGKLDINGTEYNIEFVYMDTEGKEETTVNVYQRLIEEEDVIAIIGPDSSKCALAAGPVAQNAGCPAVSTFATNTAVTEVGDYIFRACFLDPFQGQVAATYCWDAGYKTAAIMFNNADAYAVGLKDAFIENFEAKGGEVLAIEEYSGSDVKDYNVQLTKLAATNPDVVLFPNLNVELGLQIQQARTAGITCPIVCGDSADTPEVAEVAGSAIENVAYVSAFSAESTEPAAVEFVEAYTALYPDELPNSNAELTYEATRMVITALQNATEVTRDGVRDALAGITNLELPSGSMTMGEDRNPVKGAVIMQYGADGVSHYVSSVTAE